MYIDKVLTAFSISQLDPYQQSLETKLSKKCDTISSRVISNHVSFFNTGVCYNKSLVVTMRKGITDSTFKAYEPVCGNLKNPKNSKFLVSKTSFMSKPPAWFKLYKEFYIGIHASSIHFLRTKFLVGHNRGFDIIDLDNLGDVNNDIIDLRNRDYQFMANSGAKPLNIFRCAENLLVCYDKFAFLITSQREYIKTQKR